jgi:hypothetical protein
VDVERDLGIHEIAGLAVPAGAIPLPDPDAAGQEQRLGPTARLDEAALDQELVQPDP